VNIRGAGGIIGDESSSRDGCGVGDGYSRFIGEGENKGDSSTLVKGGQGVGV
jgi:hypothetical protein